MVLFLNVYIYIFLQNVCVWCFGLNTCFNVHSICFQVDTCSGTRPCHRIHTQLPGLLFYCAHSRFHQHILSVCFQVASNSQMLRATLRAISSEFLLPSCVRTSLFGRVERPQRGLCLLHSETCPLAHCRQSSQNEVCS